MEFIYEKLDVWKTAAKQSAFQQCFQSTRQS